MYKQVTQLNARKTNNPIQKNKNKSKNKSNSKKKGEARPKQTFLQRRHTGSQ